MQFTVQLVHFLLCDFFFTSKYEVFTPDIWLALLCHIELDKFGEFLLNSINLHFPFYILNTF